MGTCYVIGSIIVSAKGGSGASSGSTGAGGSYASAKFLVTRGSYGYWAYSYASGGGGGGGGCGGSAPRYAIGGGGSDGNDGGNGYSGYALDGTTEEKTGYTTPGPSGKAGTSRGNSGGVGTLYVSTTASVNVDRTKLSASTHTAAQYSITFDANGGTFASSTISATATLGCALPDCIPAPTKDGCAFVGWAPDKAGTLMWYGQNGTKNPIIYTNPSNTTLYAVWKVSPTWYVDAATGDDLHSGLSWDCAKKTIQSAIDAASDGDEILVGDGVYTGDSNPTSWSAIRNTRNIHLVIRSINGPSKTILDGQHQRRCFEGATKQPGQTGYIHETFRDLVTLEGFTFQNGFCESGGSGVLTATLKNCIIEANETRRYAAVYEANCENCLIFGNVAWNDVSGATAPSAAYRCSLVNCTIVGNTNMVALGASAIGVSAVTNCIVVGNTVTNALVENEVLGTDVTVFHSCLDIQTAGTGNIVADPCFVNAANGNYRLREDSPCIDAGDSSYSALAIDLEGNQRTLGRAIDMGAFEFHNYPARPTITPPNGTVLSGTTNVIISCATEGATIYYTTDGSEPTEESAVYHRFRISGKSIVKAVAVKNGLYGETAVAEYALGQCASPVITPGDGSTFNWSRESVSIAWTGEDGVLRYTTDGSDPTAESPVYVGPFTIDETTVVKAKAFGDQFFDSAVVTAALTRVWVNVATPTIAADSTFAGSKTLVTLSCANETAVIRYTLDGSDPDLDSAIYTEPFAVTESCTVKAYAVCEDYLDSAVASFDIERVWGIGDTLGDPDQVFTTGGDAPFFRVDDATAPLGEAMRSGAITHNQASTMTTTVEGPGTVSFQWKTSCEDSGGQYDWDHAEFEVDGAVVAYLDGEPGWQTVSYAIEGDGSHTLLWRYVKDDVESEGEDCCWVADFRWTPNETPASTETQTTPEPVPYSWLDQNAASLLAAHGGDYEAAGNDTAANGVNKVWECYVAGIDPEDADAKFEATITMGADGKPVVAHDPPLTEEEAAKRTYRTLGKRTLDPAEEWTDVTDESDLDAAGWRFFKVKVEMK